MGTTLAIFGAAGHLPYIVITGVLGGWCPLNMLFTMLLLTLICWLIDHGTPVPSLLAAVAFSLGGSLVEYWWPGLLLGLACWGYCKQASRFRLTLVMIATAALWLTNPQLLGQAPCLFALAQSTTHMPEDPRLSLPVLPSHLTALWAFISNYGNPLFVRVGSTSIRKESVDFLPGFGVSWAEAKLAAICGFVYPRHGSSG
ncbi:MAG: hypothetical protein IPI20_19880 [Rhodoferax sp.]|nr:hypothetical protein [Rhodoferax sp.]